MMYRRIMIATIIIIVQKIFILKRFAYYCNVVQSVSRFLFFARFSSVVTVGNNGLPNPAHPLRPQGRREQVNSDLFKLFWVRSMIRSKSVTTLCGFGYGTTFNGRLCWPRAPSILYILVVFITVGRQLLRVINIFFEWPIDLQRRIKKNSENQGIRFCEFPV